MNVIQRITDLGLRTERSVMRTKKSSVPELRSGPGDGTGSPTVTTEKRYANTRTLFLYLLVALGAIGEAAFRDFATTGTFQITGPMVAWGFVLGAVIFRTVFSGRLDGVHNTVMQCLIAFENGYFGNSILKTMAAAASKLSDS
jgi:hypothetical protein